MATNKQVYDACAEWMAGRPRAAQELGLEIKNLSDANRIMTESFKRLSASERASDYWQTMRDT